MLTIIGHLDTLLNFDFPEIYDFERDNENFHVDLIKMKKAGVKIAVFAVFVEPEYKLIMPWKEPYSLLTVSTISLKNIKNWS